MLTVIVPVRNGGQAFQSCLEALQTGRRKPDELIVVDDGSTDESPAFARRYSAQVMAAGNPPVGPARARNLGAAAANGDILLFVDADVVVHADTLERVERDMLEHPEIAALFGSYDDRPPHRGLVSRYKNLQHHFTHQKGRQEASTFWCGCGAVRRAAFLEVGGFSQQYAHPSIEDIELGLRLKQAGCRIWLCGDVQVTHLKRWTLRSWLRTDIFDRAVPWSRLIFASSKLPLDLNLDLRSRFSAAAAWMMLIFLVFSLVMPLMLGGALLMALALVYLNFDLYRFFKERGGFAFAVEAAGLHVVYYCYSSLTFVMIWIESRFRKMYG